MIVFSLFITLTALEFAQSCSQGEADKFYKCFEKSVPIKADPQKGRIDEFDEINGTDYRTKLEECYRKNHCKPPSHKTNETQKQCLKSNFEKFTKCLNDKGDLFPRPSDKNDNLNKEWDIESKEFVEEMFARPLDKNSCPAADTVKTCLKNLKSSTGNHTKLDKEKRKEMFNKICSDVRSCITKMPRQCQGLLQKTLKDLCDCGTAQKSNFSKCLANKKFEERVLKDLCKDPCSQGFRDDEEEEFS